MAGAWGVIASRAVKLMAASAGPGLYQGRAGLGTAACGGGEASTLPSSHGVAAELPAAHQL